MSKLWRYSGKTSNRNLMLTPLIDIIFLITIFFVLNTSFALNPSFDVDLPDAITGESTLEDQIIVTLAPPDRIFIGEEEISVSGLSGKLNIIVQQLGDLNPADQQVLVRGDETLAYGFLMKVLDNLRASGLTNISLVTEKTGG